MINFKVFSWRNSSHQKLAEKGVDILFYEERNPNVRFGYLFEKEYDDFTRMDYRVLCKSLFDGKDFDEELDAENILFCVVNQENY